ncbi:MAG: S1C family serine protease, partial [Lachnospiraceae bacterium]|nr:S1C family serine protease [Lachnospiraceae bacterium]
MYENNYPNNYDHSVQGQNRMNHTNQSQGNGNTYQYGSNGSFSGANNGFYSERGDGHGYGRKPEKRQSSNFGVGKKLIIGICCGLLFGIFAGLGFQAIDFAADFMMPSAGKAQVQENSLSEEDSQTAGENDSSEGKNGTAQAEGSQVTMTTVTDVTQVVKDAMPSVVSVNGKYIEKMTFWGQEFSQEGMGSGSGIIVGKNDTELLLVTNFHVVQSAEELTVQFVNGDQAQAQVK